MRAANFPNSDAARRRFIPTNNRQPDSHTKMTTTASPELVQVRNRLIELMRPHQSTPLFQRANQFILDKTGMKMSLYLGDSSIPEADKIGVIKSLSAILESGDYSKLPTAANGQAQAPGAPAPAPKPEPKKPEAPAPEPEAPAPAPAPAPVEGDEEDPEIIEMQLKLAKAKAAAAARAKAAATAPGLTEEQVERMLKENEAKMFKAMDEAVRKAVDARIKLLFGTIASGLE